jgi:hypothetical protein
MKRRASGALLLSLSLVGPAAFAQSATAEASSERLPDPPARPQVSTGILTGLCGLGEPGSFWSDSAWCNGLRADVLFGRARNSDFALGPYLQITTAGFWDARYGAGLSWLIPVSGDFPLILSVGTGGHKLDAPALEGFLFFGPRAYNFHALYSLSAGLLLGYQRDLGGDERSQLLVAAQIDGLLLVLPFLLAYRALE